MQMVAIRFLPYDAGFPTDEQYAPEFYDVGFVGNKAMRGGIVVGVLNSRYVRNRDKLQF